MYEKKIITRQDGSTYESYFWKTVADLQWTEQQEQMQRAIDQFGTSS